jgi:hypothetical protein
MRLNLADIERTRARPGASVVLFLTDRCPVECAHCSVASLRTGGRPSGPRALDPILRTVAERPEIETVAISGGEPFAEPAALWHAVRALDDAGKNVVVHTSGYWGAEPVPERIERVLRRCSCVVLSTDTHHAGAVAAARFRAAARVVTSLGTSLVVQTLDGEKAEAEQTLARALGPNWAASAEVTSVRPLPYGRGTQVFPQTRPHPFEGRCRLVGTPVVRYDGAVTACCNERVIMGAGPGRLRKRFTTGEELDAALDDLRADSVLWALGELGPAALAPTTSGDGICGLCWRLLREPPAEVVEVALGVLRDRCAR